MKILSVDDSSTSLAMIKKTLLEQGYTELSFCQSGDEALEFLNAEAVDLILLDWHMPGLTGLDFLRIVKNNPNTKKIPIVMLTSENHPLSIEEARQSGANAYLLKPITGATFQKVLTLIYNN